MATNRQFQNRKSSVHAGVGQKTNTLDRKGKSP